MKIRRMTCDGKLPACSQCIDKGVRCEGYSHDFIFKSSAITAPRKRSEKPQGPEATGMGSLITHHGEQVIWDSTPGYSKGQSQAVPPPPLSWTMADIVALVIQNFAPVSVYDGPHKSLSRVCGGWIEALPILIGATDNGQVLASCVTALGTSIVFKGPDGRAPLADVLQAHGSALRALRMAFRRMNTQSWNQLIASIMCLCLSEVRLAFSPFLKPPVIDLLLSQLMLPTSDATWGAHANGISKLIQQRPPDFYAAGIPHKLFAGFRPILVSP
ncbi:uncharacterized protein CTRU02_214787 [Colletotrichum truncatum]|uniref:Uncharacterized protein n=1 Tax=Colletotrichum truncatum TaxID=5467 RepID=A0ACC3YFS2_COLTU